MDHTINNKVKNHPLLDQEFVKTLALEMDKKDLIFLVLILFLTLVLIVVFLSNLQPRDKFFIVIGMLILIAYYIKIKG